MLMPSALSCDSSHPPVTRLQSAAVFASPPSSPPTSAQSALGNLVHSCRTLQSMLKTPATNASERDTLPTPPMSHAPLPPRKLRLRDRRRDPENEMIPRKKVIKRSAPPPRGINKRRRATDDDMGRDDDINSDLEIGGSDGEERESRESRCRPSTPKRARIAPEVIPLGLERSDFHQLHAGDQPNNAEAEGTQVEVEADGENWSLEDDRVLVELVLEKLKLSKEEWQDCARSLGKDRNSIGRRWKSLMVNGNVGLKARSRRGKIHSTWR